MSRYDHAFGAIAAPYDHLHGDLEIDFDLAPGGYGHDFDYGHGHGHDYMDASDGSLHDYEDDYQGQGIDSDASVPDSFASSSPPPPVAVDYFDSSDDDQQDHEPARDEEAAAVLGPYDGAYAYDEDGDDLEAQTESDDEHAHDQEPYIGGGAHTLHDSHDHETSDRYSRSSDEEGSVASTVLLEDYHAAQNNAVLASSDDDASSPLAPPSQDSAESRSDSGLESDAALGSDQASPQSSGSGSSSQGLGDPHPRRHFRRPSDQIDINNARFLSSPRRSSLTPTIHPNRRLPRSSQYQSLNHDQHRRPYSDVSGLSDEEPPNQSGNHHRPVHQNQPIYFDLSSDEDDGQDHNAEEHGDENEHDLEDEDEDEDESDHSLGSEQSQGAGGGVSPEVVDLLHLQDSEDSDVQPLDQGHRLHQARAERLGRLRAHRAARIARQGNRPPRSGRAALPARWSDLEDSELELETDMDIDDELVEVVLDRPLNARPILPQRQPPRRQRAHHHNNHNNHQHGGGVDVIDLTEEPDSPVAQNHRPLRVNRLPHNHNHNQQDNPPPPNRHQGRNPRRQMAQNGRTPSFARSDGSILGNPPAVIDLTSDGPDDGRGDENDFAFDLDGFDNIPANLRLPVPVPDPPRDRRSVDILHNLGGLGRGFLGLGGNIQRYLPGFVAQRIGHPHDADIQIIGAMNPDPLAGNPPEFNYQANGFGGFGGRQPTPKPDFEAPQPARPGFTRNTGVDQETNEEMVAVCASCDNELKYSADGDDGGPRPTKKVRTKKDREEHNFWAVKACGHVYCKSCYDNRKKTKQFEDMGFKVAASATSKSTKIICAVDDCDSDVTLTGAWVGIFL